MRGKLQFFPLLLLLVSVIVVDTAFFSKHVEPTVDNKARSSRFKAIAEKYNLTRSKKGVAAVNDAVNFLLDQEDKKETVQTPPKYISPNPTTKCEGTSCPICKVTMNAILHEGTFEYLGNDAKPSYDDHCWSARVRYHTAPACQQEEAARGVVPIYKWKWTLESAKKGYCVMPDISPSKAAAAYFQRLSSSTPSSSAAAAAPSLAPPPPPSSSSNRTLTILMLGLSFMGEPFMSMVTFPPHTYTYAYKPTPKNTYTPTHTFPLTTHTPPPPLLVQHLAYPSCNTPLTAFNLLHTSLTPLCEPTPLCDTS